MNLDYLLCSYIVGGFVLSLYLLLTKTLKLTLACLICVKTDYFVTSPKYLLFRNVKCVMCLSLCTKILISKKIFTEFFFF